jgi:four helix bundle protein
VSEFGDKLKERTKVFALRIIRMTSALPRTSPGRVLGDQVLRAATSVGANYREAFRARSQAEFIAKIGDCLREIEETDYWLELIAESKLLPEQKLSEVRKESGELIGLFASVKKSSRNNFNS